MTTAYHPLAIRHHQNAIRATRSSFAFAGEPAAPRASMAQGRTRAVWVCDPSRTPSLAPKRDAKWEVDSKAEGAGS